MMRNVNLDYKGEHRVVRLCRQSYYTSVNSTADSFTIQIN